MNFTYSYMPYDNFEFTGNSEPVNRILNLIAISNEKKGGMAIASG